MNWFYWMSLLFNPMCMCRRHSEEDICPIVKMTLDFPETKNVQIGTWFIVI